MSQLSISAKLPKDLLRQLRDCEGVKIREDCEVKIVELVDSMAGQTRFYQFLQDGNEIDPVLLPQFGPLAYPYVPLAVQLEVYDILQSFQPLLAADFLPRAGPVPLLPAPVHVIGGFQYHHGTACSAVHEEIQRPHRINFPFPGLRSLPSGQVICDVNLTFANCIVVIRLRKF